MLIKDLGIKVTHGYDVSMSNTTNIKFSEELLKDNCYDFKLVISSFQKINERYCYIKPVKNNYFIFTKSSYGDYTFYRLKKSQIIALFNSDEEYDLYTQNKISFLNDIDDEINNLNKKLQNLLKKKEQMIKEYNQKFLLG